MEKFGSARLLRSTLKLKLKTDEFQVMGLDCTVEKEAFLSFAKELCLGSRSG
jgi:hypothetical protein